MIARTARMIAPILAVCSAALAATFIVVSPSSATTRRQTVRTSPVNSADHFTSTHLIRLNRACESRSASFRRALTCQEMGHALGLDHAAATSSCMFQDPSQAATTPRQHDYDVVNAIYNKYNHPS